MFNETIDYTICSYDPEHYNRIDVNLPSPQTRNAKMIITSLTTKCSIVVLNNDDFIQITVIRKEKAEALRAKVADERSKGPEGQSPEVLAEFKRFNYTLNFKSSYTNLNVESFVELLKEQTSSIGIIPEIDYTGRIILTSKLYNFMITNASYNVIQLLGIYNQTLPISGEHKNGSWSLACSSVGNYLSTPILYLVSNIGKSSFRNLNDAMNVSKIILRINNAFSADYPIVVSNADFEVVINSNDLSCAQFTLVDANMHEIKLLSPMYITIAIHGVIEEDVLTNFPLDFVRGSKKEPL